MISIECIPCILRQAIRTYKLLGYDDEEIINRVKKLNLFYTGLDWGLGAPEIYAEIFNWIRMDTGLDDPYSDLKRYWNNYIVGYYDSLKQRIVESKDPIYTAMKIALAGNIIDFGALDKFDFEETLNKILDMTLAIDDYKIFRNLMVKGGELVYILDNAGEAVLDKLFVELLVDKYNLSRVYIGVRENPFINDVTLRDLEDIDFSEVGDIEIIKFPTSLDKHREFIRDKIYDRVFSLGDVTILKGQSNYELFYSYRDIFFLLIAKCKPVADILHVNLGDGIFRYSS